MTVISLYSCYCELHLIIGEKEINEVKIIQTNTELFVRKLSSPKKSVFILNSVLIPLLSVCPNCDL